MGKRRGLLVNLDFRDFIYSALWERAMLAGLAQRDYHVDMVAVNPFAGRNLALELGLQPRQLEAHVDGSLTYIDQPDEARCRSTIDRLLGRDRYTTLILNCDASLFAHLMVEREADLANTQWLVYDRHLHIDLAAHQHNQRLRDRVAASDIHLYTILEIAASLPQTAIPELVANDDTILGSFQRLGLTRKRIHFQSWPIDDEVFAPQPNAAPKDAFVIFSGGDSGRDYATLFEAISDLPVQLRLCANNYPKPVPANVTILPRLALHQFRDEVARATLVMVPLTGQPLVSGITVVAMAKMMGKPVIASDNRIMRIHIPSNGDGGYLTQIGNPTLLRILLRGLIDSPLERERLAREGREQAVRDLSLRTFVQRMLDLQ